TPERVKVLGSELAEGQGAAGQLLTDYLVVACGSGAVRLTRLQKAGGNCPAAPCPSASSDPSTFTRSGLPPISSSNQAPGN
ncbi:hypothetical protein ACC772_39510, partial [Rhizobium ruizarguesonis]